MKAKYELWVAMFRLIFMYAIPSILIGCVAGALAQDSLTGVLTCFISLLIHGPINVWIFVKTIRKEVWEGQW